jgi:transposase
MEIDIELLLNLPHIRVTDFMVSDQEAHIYCTSRVDTGQCPSCMEHTKEITMYQERTIRDMALLGRKVYLHLQTRQFHCKDCNRYFNERFNFVQPNKTMTIRYEQYLYFLAEDICISQVSIKEDICWSTVNSVYQKYSAKHLSQRDVWQQVRYLGIDEIAIRKGKKDYACCLIDLERGIVLDFLESRQKAYLVAYFKEKGMDFCNQIELVSCDMWEGYTNLAGDIFPNAVTVIDRFHFFMHLNKALNATRATLRKEFPDEDTFKHLRWAILKNPQNLSNEEDILLEKAFKLSQELKQVYSLRNELKEIFDTDQSIQQAQESIDLWQEKAEQIPNKHLTLFLKVLQNWRAKILNFFKERVSNGVVEGLNNAIRGIIRRSFGFHNFDNLKRRILVELG